MKRRFPQLCLYRDELAIPHLHRRLTEVFHKIGQIMRLSLSMRQSGQYREHLQELVHKTRMSLPLTIPVI